MAKIILRELDGNETNVTGLLGGFPSNGDTIFFNNKKFTVIKREFHITIEQNVPHTVIHKVLIA